MNTASNVSAPAAEDLKLILPPKGTNAGAGVDWIGAGWKLFAKAPVMWIVAMLLLFVIAVVIHLVPIVGSLVFNLLSPVFAAGLVVACRALERGEGFELEHLFAGFQRQLSGLVILGLLMLGVWILIALICLGFVGFGILTAAFSGHMEDIAPALMASGMSFVLALLVGLALSVPALMLYWFAPALIIMHGTAPVEAMKASFAGCWRNMIPFLVYGVVMLILCIIAMIPIGLGLLVWIPLTITSTYAAYRQIYTEG